MIKLLIFIMVLFFAGGCNRVTVRPTVETTTEAWIRSYEIGKPISVNPGDTMVRLTKGSRIEHLRALESIGDLHLSGMYKRGIFNRKISIDVPSGTTIPVVGMLRQDFNEYIAVQPPARNDEDRYILLVDPEMKLFTDLVISEDSDCFYRRVFSSGTDLKVNFRRILASREMVRGDFQKELLFNGINDVTINITYREYINDMARPAYMQNLVYRTDSGTIRFQNITMRIDGFHDNEFRFTVVSDD